MHLRSLRERCLQTCAYEAGGLVLAVPLYAAFADRGTPGSLLLMTLLSLAVLVWSPVHNTLFDLADWRIARRVASDRPHRWRIVHAVSLEATAALVTVPILIAVGGHRLPDAVATSAGLTLLYAAYAYFFNIAYDRLRPVKPLAAPAKSATARFPPASRVPSCPGL